MLGLEADAEIRYDLFLKTVIATKAVWGLKSKEGWAVMDSTEYEDTQVMPFWSHKAYAKAVAKEEWKEYLPTEIGLDSFIDKWLKGMNEEGILTAINLNQNLLGKEIDPQELAKAILGLLDL
jgi:hypothetical protein